MKQEKEIKQAIKTLKQKYGVTGLDNRYFLAEDIDKDLRICPMGLMEKMFWDAGVCLGNNFIKVKDLQ